jgi:uncharacterized DUF497 family protein
MVDIRWSQEKNEKLKLERGISFEDVAECVLKDRYIILKRERIQGPQNIYLVPIRGYTYVVPYVIGKDGDIFLKTIYPSRKFHKVYGAGFP